MTTGTLSLIEKEVWLKLSNAVLAPNPDANVDESDLAMFHLASAIGQRDWYSVQLEAELQGSLPDKYIAPAIRGAGRFACHLLTWWPRVSDHIWESNELVFVEEVMRLLQANLDLYAALGHLSRCADKLADAESALHELAVLERLITRTDFLIERDSDVVAEFAQLCNWISNTKKALSSDWAPLPDWTSIEFSDQDRSAEQEEELANDGVLVRHVSQDASRKSQEAKWQEESNIQPQFSQAAASPRKVDWDNTDKVVVFILEKSTISESSKKLEFFELPKSIHMKLTVMPPGLESNFIFPEERPEFRATLNLGHGTGKWRTLKFQDHDAIDNRALNASKRSFIGFKEVERTSEDWEFYKKFLKKKKSPGAKIVLRRIS